MDLHSLQLRRKQLLQQQLSLPVIHQKTRPPIPQTSAKQRKQKRNQQYASETALSPQEQHIQDQIRSLFFNKQNKTSTNREYLKPRSIDSSSSKQRKDAELPRISVSHQKRNRNPSPVSSRERNRPRASLQTILMNKDEFVQQYFTQLKQKTKR